MSTKYCLTSEYNGGKSSSACTSDAHTTQDEVIDFLVSAHKIEAPPEQMEKMRAHLKKGLPIKHGGHIWRVEKMSEKPPSTDELINMMMKPPSTYKPPTNVFKMPSPPPEPEMTKEEMAEKLMRILQGGN